MSEQDNHPPKLSMSNTKQQMIKTYNELVKQLQEQREAELKPEEKIEEKATQEAVEVADALSTDGIVQGISAIKTEVGNFLGHLTDTLEQEIGKYRQVKKSVEAKERELQEIYEIQKAATSLTALIETQQRARQQFEDEMAVEKEELSREIETVRTEWEQEKERREAEMKEQASDERKRREREKDEFTYGFQREQQLAQDRFQDDQEKLEREIQYKKEQMERELTEREKSIAEKEEELNTLRAKAEAFPQEMESAVDKAVQEAIHRVQEEAKTREELLNKEFEGERNVMHTRIESLEKTVKEQQAHLAELSEQAEKAYSNVQNIAMKAIEGAASQQSLAALQQAVAEQTRKQSQDK